MFYKEDKQQKMRYIGCAVLLYILAIPFFLILRQVDMSVFLSLCCMLVGEVLGFVFLYIAYAMSFSKRLKRYRETMYQSCMTQPYIDEMKDYLKRIHRDHPTVAMMLANAYRLQGDSSSAWHAYEQLETKAISKTLRLQIQFAKLSMMVWQGDIQQAQSLYENVVAGIEKEEAFHTSLTNLKEELMIMEMMLRYRRKEVNVDACLYLLENKPHTYTMQRAWDLYYRIHLLQQVKREEEAKCLKQELSTISGDLVILSSSPSYAIFTMEDIPS